MCASALLLDKICSYKNNKNKHQTFMRKVEVKKKREEVIESIETVKERKLQVKGYTAQYLLL